MHLYCAIRGLVWLERARARAVGSMDLNSASPIEVNASVSQFVLTYKSNKNARVHRAWSYATLMQRCGNVVYNESRGGDAWDFS